MARAHGLFWVLDEEGRPVPGASIEVRNQGSTTKIAATIYAADTGSVSLANPFAGAQDGKAEFFLDTPARVDLFITKAGYQDRTLTLDIFLLTANTLGIIVGGAGMPQRGSLDFEGDTPQGADDPGNNKTIVTINHLATAVHSAQQPPQAHAHTSGGTGGTLDHANLTNVTIDQHHAETHADAKHSGPNKFEIDKAGATVSAARTKLNFQDGTYITSTVVDNAGASRVDATVDLKTTPATAPTTSAVGDAASVGSGTELALNNHRHGREAFGSGMADVAAVAADGVALTESRKDHVHGHGTGYLPDAHHAEVHKPAKHTFVGARATKSADQTGIVDSALTALTWDQEDYDTDAIHDIGTNTSRFLVPTAMGGKWRFRLKVAWDNNATGTRRILVRKGGTTQIEGFRQGATNPGDDMELDITVVLVAGDYLEGMVYHTAGANRTVLGTFTYDGAAAITASSAEFTYLGA